MNAKTLLATDSKGMTLDDWQLYAEKFFAHLPPARIAMVRELFADTETDSRKS